MMTHCNNSLCINDLVDCREVFLKSQVANVSKILRNVASVSRLLKPFTPKIIEYIVAVSTIIIIANMFEIFLSLEIFV